MKSRTHTRYKPKTAILETDGGAVKLDGRVTIKRLLDDKKLYDLDEAAKIVNLCVRYLRRLCHEGKINHHKLLGRYYMTPADVAALLAPIKAVVE